MLFMMKIRDVTRPPFEKFLPHWPLILRVMCPAILSFDNKLKELTHEMIDKILFRAHQKTYMDTYRKMYNVGYLSLKSDPF